MKFTVVIKKATGNETRVVEAESRFAVYEQIQKEGGMVVSIAERQGFAIPSFNITLFGSGVKRQQIITMARNLSAMLSAGLALARSLSVIERQSSNKHLKVIVTEVSANISKGSSFNEALAAHPKVFSKLLIAMVKAGEESGGLAEALSIVALQMERAEELSRKIKGAMIYPSVVLTAIVIVGVLMLTFVVPTLTSTFKALGVELPLSTRIITAVSDFMVAHFILVVCILVAFGVGTVAFTRSAYGKATLIQGALHVPVIGELVRETFAARASRTLASLLSSGVPVLNALSITEEVVGTPVFAKVIGEAQERVKKGDLLSAAFIDHPKLYPILMSDMVSVGEETGKLSEMLKQVAEFYEKDVEQKTKDLSTIIEPVLMIVIGIAVGIFAVAMIGPIYSLSSAI
jgi:type IV pilus assembly protein PilC